VRIVTKSIGGCRKVKVSGEKCQIFKESCGRSVMRMFSIRESDSFVHSFQQDIYTTSRFARASWGVLSKGGVEFRVDP